MAKFYPTLVYRDLIFDRLSSTDWGPFDQTRAVGANPWPREIKYSTSVARQCLSSVSRAGTLEEDERLAEVPSPSKRR